MVNSRFCSFFFLLFAAVFFFLSDSETWFLNNRREKMNKKQQQKELWHTHTHKKKKATLKKKKMVFPLCLFFCPRGSLFFFFWKGASFGWVSDYGDVFTYTVRQKGFFSREAHKYKKRIFFFFGNARWPFPMSVFFFFFFAFLSITYVNSKNEFSRCSLKKSYLVFVFELLFFFFDFQTSERFFSWSYKLVFLAGLFTLEE